jgi:anhydro-N-acetylmuramic acid kinase
MTTRWIIGLASGSGAEGADAALLEIEGVGLELRAQVAGTARQAFSREMREQLVRVGSAAPCDVRQLALLHRLLGETLAAAARQVADQASLSLQRVQCIGCPGHALCHDPDGRFPAALNLGMAAVVAERTGVTTVSDFESRDLAMGGQATPLLALSDYLLFHSDDENRLLLHLGGSARVVYVPAQGGPRDVLGFEAGPCNSLLDALMRHLTAGREAYDAGGKHAVQGRCLEPLLQRWLAIPYLQRRPPKSLPRHAFGDDFARQTVQLARQNSWSLHDLLCTATHFVARSIVQSVRRFIPQNGQPTRVVLSGGGVRNGLLWHLLEQQLDELTLEKADAYGIPTAARKPLGYGLLAALTVDGVPANAPSATGASGARLLGSLTPGSSLNWARCLAWMASQAALPAESYQ